MLSRDRAKNESWQRNYITSGSTEVYGPIVKARARIRAGIRAKARARATRARVRD